MRAVDRRAGRGGRSDPRQRRARAGGCGMRPLVRDGGVRQREYVTNRAKPGMTPAERVRLHTVVDAVSGCWIWQLVLAQGSGYGHITIHYKVYLAHRVSYEAFVGPIPAGLELDHLCRNRAC